MRSTYTDAGPSESRQYLSGQQYRWNCLKNFSAVVYVQRVRLSTQPPTAVLDADRVAVAITTLVPVAHAGRPVTVRLPEHRSLSGLAR